MKTLELFRHTDNDDDALSPEGVQAAERLGRERLTPPYSAYVSSGAARATQMAEILREATGQEDVPITEEPALRSAVEDRWRDAAKAAGKGADLEAMREQDGDLVEKETRLLGLGLRRVLESVPDGGRALLVGHSPTSEAAVLGLTGTLVQPLGKGDGVRITETDGAFSVEPIG